MRRIPALFFIGVMLLLGACSRSPEQSVSKGLLQLQEGKPAAALRSFQAAATKMDGVPEAAPVWNALGVAAVQLDREDLAESAFQQAADLDPAWADAQLNLGSLYRSQGRNEEAQAAFQRADEADPRQTDSLEHVAVALIRAGASDEALARIRQAAARRENARILSSLAVLSAESASLAERRELLQRAGALDPGFAPAQLNLAAFLDQHRLDPEQALMHYERFLQLEPDSPFVPQVVQRTQVMAERIRTGDVARPDPHRQEVEALLKQATEADDPRLALSLCLQAHAVAARVSRPDLRERALRAATTLAPDSARAQVGLARFLQEQGQEEGALQAYLAAHALAPQWPPAFEGAVLAAVMQGRTKQARELLSLTLERVKDQPDALLLVADLTRSALHSERSARDLYRELLRSFPESAAAATARTRLDD